MEALRCLKRQLARHFHRLLLKPPAAPAARAAIACNAAISVPRSTSSNALIM
jgi:hypothetical protein